MSEHLNRDVGVKAIISKFNNVRMGDYGSNICVSKISLKLYFFSYFDI